MAKAKPTTVDECIETAPPEGQARLREMRDILRKAAPGAEEKLKWRTPVFEEKRILFSFSAHKKHLNFMPTAPSLEPFRGELAAYTTGNDTVQFPYDRPLPKALIRRIARHRLKDVRENDARWMY